MDRAEDPRSPEERLLIERTEIGARLEDVFTAIQSWAGALTTNAATEAELDMPPHDEERETEILAWVDQRCEETGADKELMRRIFSVIYNEGLHRQSEMRRHADDTPQ